ncbi:unnamed protein product [Protopolystoma xenopodis]|uniref:Ryanodine receptor junctional solenoid domain-containing protein n=1 Tax=Protopolystoma xenopodis TaxID=117903 RepID=A0A3S5ALA0_9PLAT|nr:unnamed protein product [Protopolystoma xenopodis]
MLCIISFCKGVPGPLRSGFVDLLLTMHLDSHVKMKQVTGQEYLVPLDRDKLLNPKPTGRPEDFLQNLDLDKIPSVSEHISIRPDLHMDPHLLL